MFPVTNNVQMYDSVDDASEQTSRSSRSIASSPVPSIVDTVRRMENSNGLEDSARTGAGTEVVQSYSKQRTADVTLNGLTVKNLQGADGYGQPNLHVDNTSSWLQDIDEHGVEDGAADLQPPSGLFFRPERPVASPPALSAPSVGGKQPIYTRSGRVSKAGKGLRDHPCDMCGKTFMLAIDLRRHKINHKPGSFECDMPACGMLSHSAELLSRHGAQHGYHSSSKDQSTAPPRYEPLLFDPGQGEQDDNPGKQVCYCNRQASGEMVGCKSASCQRTWFHLECVGLKSMPLDGWLCPTCKSERNGPDRWHVAQEDGRGQAPLATDEMVQGPTKRHHEDPHTSQNTIEHTLTQTVERARFNLQQLNNDDIARMQRAVEDSGKMPASEVKLAATVSEVAMDNAEDDLGFRNVEDELAFQDVLMSDVNGASGKARQDSHEHSSKMRADVQRESPLDPLDPLEQLMLTVGTHENGAGLRFVVANDPNRFRDKKEMRASRQHVMSTYLASENNRPSSANGPATMAVNAHAGVKSIDVREQRDYENDYWQALEANEEQGIFDSSKEICPIPTCGRHVKDLKAHMLTHQNERPEKCPIATCEYHTRGFARKHDKVRHTLTHYKGRLTCGFCPSSAGEKTFNRADVFKRHLTSVHGVEQTPPNARRKIPAPGGTKRSGEISGICSTCGNGFASAQDFYEHLDDCVLRFVLLSDPSEAINKKLLTSVETQAPRKAAPENWGSDDTSDDEMRGSSHPRDIETAKKPALDSQTRFVVVDYPDKIPDKKQLRENRQHVMFDYLERERNRSSGTNPRARKTHTLPHDQPADSRERLADVESEVRNVMDEGKPLEAFTQSLPASPDSTNIWKSSTLDEEATRRYLDEVLPQHPTAPDQDPSTDAKDYVCCGDQLGSMEKLLQHYEDAHSATSSAVVKEMERYYQQNHPVEYSRALESNRERKSAHAQSPALAPNKEDDMYDGTISATVQQGSSKPVSRVGELVEITPHSVLGTSREMPHGVQEGSKTYGLRSPNRTLGFQPDEDTASGLYPESMANPGCLMCGVYIPHIDRSACFNCEVAVFCSDCHRRWLRDGMDLCAECNHPSIPLKSIPGDEELNHSAAFQRAVQRRNKKWGEYRRHVLGSGGRDKDSSSRILDAPARVRNHPQLDRPTRSSDRILHDRALPEASPEPGLQDTVGYNELVPQTQLHHASAFVPASRGFSDASGWAMTATVGAPQALDITDPRYNASEPKPAYVPHHLYALSSSAANHTRSSDRPTSVRNPGLYSHEASVRPAGASEGPRRLKTTAPPQVRVNGISSYWSVPEQTDFPKYIAHFGTEFWAIAMHMGTKTETMVKNHYQRLVDRGNRADLKAAAEEADRRRFNGTEEKGAPPTPTPIVRRKYDNP